MKARIITEWDLMRRDIAGAPEWLRVHDNPRGIPRVIEAVKAMIALEDPTPNKARACFAAAHHDPSGRYLTMCSGCGAQVAEAVVVGEEPDYDSSTAYLCRSCLSDAVNVMNAAVRR